MKPSLINLLKWQYRGKIEIMNRKIKNLLIISNENKAYLAGFLDGNGSIIAQIVPNSTYIYNYEIKVSIRFYQHKKRYWFIIKLYKMLNKIGALRIKTDGICELSSISNNEVRIILLMLLPYMKIKKPQAKYAIDILNIKKKMQNEADFREVCKIVDKIAMHNDSKKRK